MFVDYVLTPSKNDAQRPISFATHMRGNELDGLVVTQTVEFYRTFVGRLDILPRRDGQNRLNIDDLSGNGITVDLPAHIPPEASVWLVTGRIQTHFNQPAQSRATVQFCRDDAYTIDSAKLATEGFMVPLYIEIRFSPFEQESYFKDCILPPRHYSQIYDRPVYYSPSQHLSLYDGRKSKLEFVGNSLYDTVNSPVIALVGNDGVIPQHAYELSPPTYPLLGIAVDNAKHFLSWNDTRQLTDVSEYHAVIEFLNGTRKQLEGVDFTSFDTGLGDLNLPISKPARLHAGCHLLPSNVVPMFDEANTATNYRPPSHGGTAYCKKAMGYRIADSSAPGSYLTTQHSPLVRAHLIDGTLAQSPLAVYNVYQPEPVMLGVVVDLGAFSWLNVTRHLACMAARHSYRPIDFQLSLPRAIASLRALPDCNAIPEAKTNLFAAYCEYSWDGTDYLM